MRAQITEQQLAFFIKNRPNPDESVGLRFLSSLGILCINNTDQASNLPRLSDDDITFICLICYITKAQTAEINISNHVNLSELKRNIPNLDISNLCRLGILKQVNADLITLNPYVVKPLAKTANETILLSTFPKFNLESGLSSFLPTVSSLFRSAPHSNGRAETASNKRKADAISSSSLPNNNNALEPLPNNNNAHAPSVDANNPWNNELLNELKMENATFRVHIEEAKSIIAEQNAMISLKDEEIKRLKAVNKTSESLNLAMIQVNRILIPLVAQNSSTQGQSVLRQLDLSLINASPVQTQGFYANNAGNSSSPNLVIPDAPTLTRADTEKNLTIYNRK